MNCVFCGSQIEYRLIMGEHRFECDSCSALTMFDTDLTEQEVKERYTHKLLNIANVVEAVLGNLQHDLWRLPEPVQATITNTLQAVVDECRGPLSRTEAAVED